LVAAHRGGDATSLTRPMSPDRSTHTRAKDPRSRSRVAIAFAPMATERFERLWTSDWKTVAQEATHGMADSPNWIESQAVFQAGTAKAQEATARLTMWLVIATIALAIATIVLVIVTAATDDDSGSAALRTVSSDAPDV